MIPKVIHYCWFGGKPLPKTAQRCIDSWKKYFPGYEIKRWDETNYDVNVTPYTRDAYAAKKYAFVSDYARFDILYREGGVYFDTDVEVIRAMDDIIAAGPFMGMETVAPGLPVAVAPGLGICAPAGNEIYKELLSYYQSIEYTDPANKALPDTIVTHTTKVLKRHGLRDELNVIQKVGELNIYPSEYFCPLSTVDGKLHLTSNTRSIHLYDQSWQSPARRYGRKILLNLGGPQLIKRLKPILLKNN